MNNNLEKVLHLSIIIDNPIHSNYLWISNPNSIYDSLFLSHWPFLFQYINLHLAYSFFSFFFFFIPFHKKIPHIFTSRIYIYNIYHCQEGISYYLGYLGISIQRGGKKSELGCAIDMKEYTIMMYLTNQIPSSNNEAL